MVGGPCDYGVTPVPIGLGFGFGTALGLGLRGPNLGLGLDKMTVFLSLMTPGHGRFFSHLSFDV